MIICAKLNICTSISPPSQSPEPLAPIITLWISYMKEDLRIFFYTVFLICFSSPATLAQFPIGIYDLNTSTNFHYDTSDYNNTSLVLYANSNFLLDYKPFGMDCLSWNRYTGKWEYKDSLVVLTETKPWQPEGLFVKMNNQILGNSVKLRIIDDNFNPIKNSLVTFKLDHCKDTVVLQSDSLGFVVLNLNNIKPKLNCSSDSIKSGRLTIFYLDLKTKENTQKNIFFYNPSHIEAILITRTQKKNLTRKIIYKTVSDKLIFLGAFYDSSLLQSDDNDMFKGEFKRRVPK